jgi:predicted P-loop ATPase
MRWAGTWHRKNPDAPRLARIVEENADAEIILEDALAELEGQEALRDSPEYQPSSGKTYTTTADDDLLLACGERIPNPDLGWAAWNRIGMAFWRASGGSEAGFQAFDALSRKSAKYDSAATRARWDHFAGSPPDRLTVGTLVYEARKGDPDFLRLQPEPPAAVDLNLDALPAQLREAIEADPKLADSWAKGAKLTKGRDASAKGLEFSLVVYLAWREHDDDLIELAVRHYPHGQIGGGKLTGGNADRRLDKLLEEAEKIRAKAQRWRDAQAWFQDLQLSEEGTPRDCLANGSTILNKDPAFDGKIRFDEHRGAPICRDMPWRLGADWHEWTNTDDIRLAEWCQMRGVPLRPTTCADAVMAVADDNHIHPIRDRLDGLTWDGKPRLSGWLETYLGAKLPDGETDEAKHTYVREVGRRWLISAVARIYKPGCKADCALILEGSQGIGKSTALAALVPLPEWFSDEISDLGSKDSAQDLRGKWIIELAELSAMKRGDIERTKAFMSRAVDHYRPSYGRRSQDFPRQCVFSGTTNSESYFGDETGNRRFWPVRVGKIDVAGLRESRDQLWAEAVAAFKAGETWWLSGDVEKAAAEEQAERRIVDPWESYIVEWLSARGTKPVTLADAFGALEPA